MTKIVSIICGIYLCFHEHITIGIILILVPAISYLFNKVIDDVYEGFK